MQVVVLFNQPLDPGNAAEQDVLVQRDFVAAALASAGHEVDSLAITLNFEAVRQRLTELGPDVVFNLVEALAGTDRLMPLATLLLEGLGVAFTGCGTAAMLANASKVAAKESLRDAGLPTADWLTTDADCTDAASGSSRWIIKPISEHASVGMDDACVVMADNAQAVLTLVRSRTAASGRVQFAERYVDGREFNLSLLTNADGSPQVLPPAEIDFSAFPQGKPRIVGHAAKWEADSFEYQQTPRTFDFPTADASLLNELQRLAEDCWRLFGLRGYARVDFRVDANGRPWILEVNVNPCLSPDAGFAAALARAAIAPADAFERIVQAALVSHSR
jgi:D-alanine-D-alanine ligase